MPPRGGEPVRINLSARLAELGSDLCLKLPDLAHIDTRHILFALGRSRAAGTHGTYARIAPLRFAAGNLELTRRRGRFRETYRMPALVHEGREILYLIHILVPRFLRLSFEEKLRTLIHELYHISVRCDGDIRRFAGRNFAHGSSRRAYNRHIDTLADRYLTAGPDPLLLDWLHLEEEEWLQQKVRLTGLSVPLPRPILVARSRL